MSARWHPAGETPTLGTYGRFVRRHLALIAALAVLGTAVAGVVVARTPPQFAASTSLAVAAQPTGGDLDENRPRVVSLDTDAAILTSGDVLTRAADAVGFPGGAVGLRDSLDVSALPNTRVLVVRVTDVDRERAVSACREVVDEFLRTRAAAEVARAAAATAALTAQIDDVLADLTLLTAADPGADPEAGAGETGETVAADDATAALYDRLALLREELRIASASASAAPGTVVSAADAPATGVRPGAAGALLSGLLLGSGAGLGLAALRTAPTAGPRPHRSQPTESPAHAR